MIDAGDDFQQKTKALIPIIAMVLATVVVLAALMMGYDGTVILTALAGLFGVGGFTIREVYNYLKEK